jgi:hypothetical protein
MMGDLSNPKPLYVAWDMWQQCNDIINNTLHPHHTSAKVIAIKV